MSHVIEKTSLFTFLEPAISKNLMFTRTKYTQMKVIVRNFHTNYSEIICK